MKLVNHDEMLDVAGIRVLIWIRNDAVASGPAIQHE